MSNNDRTIKIGGNFFGSGIALTTIGAFYINTAFGFFWIGGWAIIIGFILSLSGMFGKASEVKDK